ncbi:hypothetical protein JVT61DRAFT_43 [Boletus reticuloceps]|uniref:Fungal-type protein kinase domain-containing protein n=1 Tax=Boletus reticuloceps TaxID=495285 RepID=A0A8I3AGG1_9AGAM|nr:hypothetical protein JVT61DRAFT_43 [Boletus reticuloceps]
MSAHTPPPHNVITFMSMMPYHMKTASIPTSARVYGAVPLNQDLTNKLEGAIVLEPDRKHPKDHYILHPYKTLPPPSIAPNSSAVTCDNQLLYDSTSQCWDPSYLPHILHNSPSSSQHASRKSWTVHKKKQLHNSAPPLDKKRWSMTVTRIYQGINGPATETIDGTYLPKAGMEEQTVALWLNYITNHIHGTHDLSLPVECRPIKSDQREYMMHTMLLLKPDIAQLQPDEYDIAPSKFSQRNVASFLELTSEEFSSHLCLQLTKKAYAVFVAQPGHRFLIPLSVANQKLRLYHFDHSGVVHSHGYNIHQHATFLLQVLYVLTAAPLEHLGYDPTLSFSTTILHMKHLHTEPYILVDGKKYIIECILFYSKMICGWATLCFVIRDPKAVCCQGCWTSNGRVMTEEGMLTRIKEGV